MHRDAKGKLRFDDNYERMAHFVMETHLGRTQTAIAEEFKLSHQRVHQIVKHGYAISGTKPSDPPEKVAFKLRRFVVPPRAVPGTPEHFCLHEIHEAAPPLY